MEPTSWARYALPGFALLAALAWQYPRATGAPAKETPSDATTSGMLTTLRDGRPAAPCPLKHTAVKADISGFLARVTVTQEFTNPTSETIEAVYTFPLPNRAAVDDMTMRVGERTVRGIIKTREEARQVFEQARAQGRTASLLDQERPNIFTQSVTNIPAGGAVKVQISYVETLKYEAGEYEFSFPMVVGPRYIPGQQRGTPDAARISPPVTRGGQRPGHDISLSVTLDAGVPLDSLQSPTHDVAITRPGVRQANLSLRNQQSIPNKDFVLRYDVLGGKIEDAVLTHRAGRGGFFTLILQPPDRVAPADVTPKEIVFVLDTSGSMEGFPIEKAKESMRLALDGLHPRDTFNLITFAGDTHILFPQPVPATPENLRRAQSFLAGRRGSGGTEMMKAIRAALAPGNSSEHVRVVCFMTDGYVGDDMAIIAEVKRHPHARVFSFGIGSSVNRFLLDEMARVGRGEVEYVGLQDDGSAAARRFHERVRTPVLTDIRIDWAGLPVADVSPTAIPDLFSARPVIVTGRYTGAATGTIKLHGEQGGRPVTREIRVALPERQPAHDVLATLWARQRIGDLMREDYAGIQRGTPSPQVKENITQLGLAYRLMTQYTSFVAVEERTTTEGGRPKVIQVPVALPEGVSEEGIFGSADAEMSRVAIGYGAGANFGGGAYRLRQSASLARAPQGVVGGLPPVAPLPSQPVPLPEVRKADAAPKLHPGLQPVASTLVKSGKLELQVWLRAVTPATLASLKQLGFEVIEQGKTANLVVGRLSPDKLAALVALDVVRYVAPRT